ncbi:MAG: cytochrome c [Candidatus Poribacteria bacterium]|nr:cytochrome c [Candidatus Poribacteria bacterium]
MRHLLIIVGMFAASMSWLIWICRVVDPSTRYGSKVEYNYARFCAGCHGPHGEGNGRIGRFKKLEPADLTEADLWENRSDNQLIHSIDAGKDDMPAFFYYLTHEEQSEILTFIKENFRPTPVHD